MIPASPLERRIDHGQGDSLVNRIEFGRNGLDDSEMADEGLQIARIADGRSEQRAFDRGRDHRTQGLVGSILDHNRR
jgi:hypothetical protein